MADASPPPDPADEDRLSRIASELTGVQWTGPTRPKPGDSRVEDHGFGRWVPTWLGFIVLALLAALVVQAVTVVHLRADVHHLKRAPCSILGGSPASVPCLDATASQLQSQLSTQQAQVNRLNGQVNSLCRQLQEVIRQLPDQNGFLFPGFC